MSKLSAEEQIVEAAARAIASEGWNELARAALIAGLRAVKETELGGTEGWSGDVSTGQICDFLADRLEAKP